MKMNPFGMGASILGLLIACSDGNTPGTAGNGGNTGPTGKVDFTVAQKIIQQRCLSCHSVKPTRPGVTRPEAGVAFDTPTEIKNRANMIRLQAVVRKQMPPDASEITAEERQQLGAWVDGGANIDTVAIATALPSTPPVPSPEAPTTKPVEASSSPVAPSPQSSIPCTGAISCAPTPLPVSTTSPTPTVVPTATPSRSPVTFAIAGPVFQKHCVSCHQFTNVSQVRPLADKIKTKVVIEKIMPPSGFSATTLMTNEERLVLGKWVDDGAK